MTRRSSSNCPLGKFWRATDGGAAAEFALVLPLLLILLFAGLEIGRALHDYHTVSKSVRDAGRYAARWPGTCPDVGEYALTPTVEAETRHLALTGRIDEPNGDDDYLLSQWRDTDTVTVRLICSEIGDWSGLYAGEAYMRTVRVTAEAPFEFLYATLLGLPDGRITLSLQHTQPHVGE